MQRWPLGEQNCIRKKEIKSIKLYQTIIRSYSKFELISRIEFEQLFLAKDSKIFIIFFSLILPYFAKEKIRESLWNFVLRSSNFHRAPISKSSNWTRPHMTDGIRNFLFSWCVVQKIQSLKGPNLYFFCSNARAIYFKKN